MKLSFLGQYIHPLKYMLWSKWMEMKIDSFAPDLVHAGKFGLGNAGMILVHTLIAWLSPL